MAASQELVQTPVDGHAQARRPSLPRANSSPAWPKTVSMESLKAPRTLQPSITPSAPLLRKRHSTYALSSHPDQVKVPVPVPGVPPTRLIRNPARITVPNQPPLSFAKEKLNRPSTATTTTSIREDITPWEFAPGHAHDDPPRSPPPSSTGSPLSTRPRQSLATGPLSEVAPWEMYPAPMTRSTTSRSSLTSSLVEEVTPWELQPVPDVLPTRSTLSTLATGPVEDVTPWELDPIPSTELPAPISGKRYSGHVPVTTGHKAQPDANQVRRRKSTSAKSSKARSALFGLSSYRSGDSSGSSHVYSEGGRSSSKSASKLSHAASSSRPPLSPLQSFSTLDATSHANRNLSTTDRTILKELQRNLEAKDAQFVMKGEGNSLVSPLGRGGKKHHAYSHEVVPYPRSYDREVIDLDVWETVSCQDICESLTWHVFDTPPTKVLDLGCGTGTWILNCAKIWKDCHFVGKIFAAFKNWSLNIPSKGWMSFRCTPPTPLPESHGSTQIYGIPFPDGEFDFVHIKRIALGVPEDKWDKLFEEILRVMKPGGAFEMLEEDLFFPGKLIDSDDESDLDSGSKRSSLLSSHRTSTQSHLEINRDSMTDSDPPSFRSDISCPTPTTATFATTPSRSNSPVADVMGNDDSQKEAQELMAQLFLPLSSSTIDDQLSPATIRGHLQVKSPRSPFAASAISLNVSSNGTSVHDVETKVEPRSRTRSRGYSLTASLPVPDTKSQRGQGDIPPLPTTEAPPSVPSIPLLLRTIQKPPPNPRDHSLLEAIYTRLLESRFINMSPLALLANYVALYFKDVRTHPPLQYHFPARITRSNSSGDVKESQENIEEEEYDDDSDDARDAILPSPISRTSKRSPRRMSAQSQKEEAAYIGVKSLLNHSSPYITLDESRASALSPSIKGMFPDVSSTRLQRAAFLPNTTMHLDLKTLNLHLSLRAAEIIACSETMWECVQALQALKKRERESRVPTRNTRAGSGSVEMPARKSTTSLLSAKEPVDANEEAIASLTREEFDGLINKFEMDMRDKCGLADALGDRLGWRIKDMTLSQERDAFQTACEKWDKWEEEQLASTPSPQRSKHLYPRSPQPRASTSTLSTSGAIDNGLHSGRSRSQDRKIKDAVSSSSALLPPTRRLSRAMRVFVAWKSLEDPFEDP
ncbi:hypothetical protein H0H92_015340 [Tricholoma furcatifolium]|nr:hypothetical protein H0H92_015340 [Tricholoma furcatifolium]